MRSPLRIGAARQLRQILAAQLRDLRRQKQPALAAEALHNGLRRRIPQRRIPGTYIIHNFTTFSKD